MGVTIIKIIWLNGYKCILMRISLTNRVSLQDQVAIVCILGESKMSHLMYSNDLVL